MLPFTVSLHSGTPLYEQVIYAITKAIVSGQLRPGDPFPSVRTLSQELRINPNTSYRIVAALVDQGLLVVHPGIGTVVADHPPAADDASVVVGDEAERLVIEARRAGVSLNDLVKAVRAHWARLGGQGGFAMTHAIETENLTRRFRRSDAVNGLSLQVPPGKIFALVGPNGAGKTTTIKLLMNLIRPTRGTARVLGIDSTRLGPAELARIGYVSESQRLPDWMTVDEMLEYVRPFYPTWDVELCARLKTRLGLSDRNRLRSLSRGTRMKAALLASLAYRPELLVLDEPFSGLDPLVRVELTEALLELPGEHPWTVFLSSHDIEEVERLADVIGFIDRGRLVFAEPVESLLARFKLVEVVAREGDVPATPMRPEWILQGAAGRTARFVDTDHAAADAPQRIAAAFPDADVRASEMSLRDILVALAQGVSQRGGAPMNGLLHLLATDLRRHRWLLLLWLVIATGSAATVGLMPMAAATPRAASQAGLLYFLLSCTYVALFVCLVPLVVQGDAAVGSDVFWMTRPIPPRSLFAEKLALLFVALAILPVAADGVLMAAYGVPFGEAAGVAAQGVLFKLLWIAMLMILAVLTASLPRFALLAGVVMAVSVGLVAVSVAMTVSQFNDDPPLSQTGTFFSQTAFMLAVGGILAGGLGLSLVQYATRRRALSIVVGGACAIVGFAAAASMPTPTADEIGGDAPGWARDPSGVHLSVDPEQVRIGTQPASRSGRGWKLVLAPVYVAGLQPAWSAEVKIRESTWETNARTAWTSPAPITFQPARIEKDETSITTATRQLLGVSRVVQVQASWDRPPSAVLAVIDDRRFPSLPDATGTYAAKATVSLVRHAIEGALPLKQGVEYRQGAHRVSISRVYRETGGVTMLLRVSYANSMFSQEPQGERSYFIRNSVASEAIPASLELADVSGVSFLPWMTFMGGGGNSGNEGSGFNVQSWLVKVGSVSGPNGPIWRLTDGWLSNAEFVVVTSHREGSVDRDLLVHNFPLRTAADAETP